MIFLVLLQQVIFLFLENMILFFRRKMKDDLSQKKYMEIWYFLEISWKDGLSKKSAPDYTILFSFSRKYDLVLQAENEDHPSQKKENKTKKNKDIFFVYSVRVLPLFPMGVVLPFYQKAKTIFSWVNMLRGGISGTNEKDDIHPN